MKHFVIALCILIPDLCRKEEMRSYLFPGTGSDLKFTSLAKTWDEAVALRIEDTLCAIR